MKYPVALLTSTLLLSTSYGGGISPGQIDDFQDGTTQNWKIGQVITPPTPVHNMDCGEEGTGDDCLTFISNGGGAGGKLIIVNGQQWAGDYSATGVTAIRFKARLIDGDGVVLRVGMADSMAGQAGGASDVFGPPGALSKIGATLTDEYQDFVIPITEDQMDSTFGTPVGETLADVVSLWIVDNPDQGNWNPRVTMSEADIDDIELIAGPDDLIFADDFEGSAPTE